MPTEGGATQGNVTLTCAASQYAVQRRAAAVPAPTAGRAARPEGAHILYRVTYRCRLVVSSCQCCVVRLRLRCSLTGIETHDVVRCRDAFMLCCPVSAAPRAIAWTSLRVQSSVAYKVSGRATGRVTLRSRRESKRTRVVKNLFRLVYLRYLQLLYHTRRNRSRTGYLVLPLPGRGGQ